MCMSVCWHVHMSEDVWRPQKRVLDHLELELQADLINPMSVLGNQIWVFCKNSTYLLLTSDPSLQLHPFVFFKQLGTCNLILY